MKRRIAAIGLVFWCLAGCLEVAPRQDGPSSAEHAGAGKPVWPAPPDPAKIAYLSGIAGMRDLDVTRSFLRWLAESLAGASEQWLVRPTGVSAQGNVLAIADPGAPALFIFDRAAKRFRTITRANGADLRSPVSVALAGEDRVYVADSVLRHVYVFDRDGQLRDTWGGEELKRPTALAFDGQRQRLYVTDTGSHRVLAYDTAGHLLFTFGRRGIADGEFNWPGHLCLDRAGQIYVVDALNFRVQIFDTDGHFLSQFGHHGDGSGDFARPKGIGVDSHGHVYVADALFDAVQIFDQQGQFLLSFGQQGSGPGEFWLPVGLGIDVDDRIYVADSYNQRVQVFQLVGGR
jgi:DNA-binding beta-propeller fold protein YncE